MLNLTAVKTKFPPVYLFGLFALIFTLPLFEAPKTLFLLLFLASCAIRTWKNRAAEAWGGDDLLLFAWMLSGYVVAQFAAIHFKEWGGANGPLQLALLLLFLKHTRLDSNTTRLLLYAVLLSTLFANLEGLWELYHGKITAFELRSVGHVNHSAIYLCLNFGLALAMALTLKRNQPLPVMFFVLFCLLLTAASVIMSNSRSTVMTMGVIALFCGWMWLRRSKLALLLLVFLLAVTAGGLYFGKAQVIQKHLQQTSHGTYLGERGPIWNSALLAWRHAPLFGVGIKNYSKITPELQQQWLAEEGKNYVPGHYLAYAHAHNFYLNLLAEQGLFGFTITLAVFARIAWLLYRRRPQPADSDDYWTLWLAASGAVLVVLVNGLFNTTLHHEHGLLAVLLLGLWWANSTPQDQG